MAVVHLVPCQTVGGAESFGAGLETLAQGGLLAGKFVEGRILQHHFAEKFFD